jgi:hypothetical protein
MKWYNTTLLYRRRGFGDGGKVFGPFCLGRDNKKMLFSGGSGICVRPWRSRDVFG